MHVNFKENECEETSVPVIGLKGTAFLEGPLTLDTVTI